MNKIIDTRDLNDRLLELKAKADLIAEIQEELGDADDNTDTNEIIERLDDAKDDFDESEQEELKELENLESEIPEWYHGNTLIHEDEFVDYCKEMLEDCGDLPKELPWYIENAIDWEEVADALKADYGEISFQNENYYFRNC